MIFLRLEYDLRVPVRGSKYDTYQSHADSRADDHTGHIDAQPVTETSADGPP